ncbi:MAG: ferrochelatase [Woeseiaceae bacterium]|nr:ferrochelatase [Woeseiaceae bacterium]
MPTFESKPLYKHGDADALGVLVVNLGTPDAPTTSAVRRYLAQFLWDGRVIELPRPLWWLILNGFILRFRPSRSAEAYAEIWGEDGSPLLKFCEDMQRGILSRLEAAMPGPVHVSLGMSYGSPSIDSALAELYERGARRIVLLPLYPQYSGTTTGSVFDAVTQALSRRRWVPEFRFINHYHDYDGYIAALAASIREYWDENGKGDKLMFSFHGVPRDTLLKGDPYHCHCQKTARLVAERLELPQDEWVISFQSRVGRAEWLRPYTDETIEELGAQKLGSLDVVCPGFSADCLETLEEIAMQNAELFEESGGGKLNYIPCLNARDDHIDFLSQLVLAHAQGWPETSMDWDEGIIADARQRTRQRALDLGADE